jgi:hypothetical protein
VNVFLFFPNGFFFFALRTGLRNRHSRPAPVSGRIPPRSVFSDSALSQALSALRANCLFDTYKIQHKIETEQQANGSESDFQPHVPHSDAQNQSDNRKNRDNPDLNRQSLSAHLYPPADKCNMISEKCGNYFPYFNCVFIISLFNTIVNPF